jgi:hypothetical protein
MAFEATGAGDIGFVTVHATSGRGATPEELVERAMDKVMYVSMEAPPEIKVQALEYQDRIRAVLLHYLRAAVAAEHTTIAFKLREAGFPELIPLLSR